MSSHHTRDIAKFKKYYKIAIECPVTNLEEAYMYQTIIIGGGPSGLMAAVAASEQSSNVLLIEKERSRS